MSAADAEAAIQQAGLHRPGGRRADGCRCMFTVGRHPGRTRPCSASTSPSRSPAGKVLDTLSLVSISDPNQGQVVSGSLKVTGVNNGFEGTVVVYLERNGKHHW